MMDIVKCLSVCLVMSLLCACAGPERELAAYWRGHDFTSLESFGDIRAAEDEFDGYVRLLDKTRPDVAGKSLTEFLDSASGNSVAYAVWAGWCESYFHSLASPYRNDELFSLFLDKVTEDGVLEPYMLGRFLMMRKVFHNGLPGARVSPVVLKDAGGVEFSLADYAPRRVLVLFLDAGCSSCLQKVNETEAEYRGCDLEKVVVLVHGTPALTAGLATRLPDGWRPAWCPSGELEAGEIYDITLLPSRIIVGADGLVGKSYH